MSADDFWVKASAWATKNFTCGHIDDVRCGKPIRRIRVKMGEPQDGYCYPHYLAAKNVAAPSESKERTGE